MEGPPQFRLRTIFVVSALVGAGCVAARWVGFLPDHPYLFLAVMLELAAAAAMAAIIQDMTRKWIATRQDSTGRPAADGGFRRRNRLQ